jgi:hypothetical protein
MTTKNNQFNTLAWGLCTAFFLLIAWATSFDDNEEAELPFLAEAYENHVTLINKSGVKYDSLNLILNGIYSIETISVDSLGEVEVNYSEFQDKTGETKPAGETADVLEIYHAVSANSLSYPRYSKNYLRLNLRD